MNSQVKNNDKSSTQKSSEFIDSCLLKFYNKCCDQYANANEKKKRIKYSFEDLKLIQRNTPKNVSATFINSLGEMAKEISKQNYVSHSAYINGNFYKIDNRYKWTAKNDKKMGNTAKIVYNTATKVKDSKTQDNYVKDIADDLKNLSVVENKSSFNADELSKLGPEFKNSYAKLNEVLDDNRLIEGTKSSLKEEKFLVTCLKHGELSKEEIKTQNIEKISKGHKIKGIDDEKTDQTNKSSDLNNGKKLQESFVKQDEKALKLEDTIKPGKNANDDDEKDEVTDDDGTSSSDETSTSSFSISVDKLPLLSGLPPPPKTQKSLPATQPPYYSKTENQQEFLSTLFQNNPSLHTSTDAHSPNPLLNIPAPHTTSDQATLNFYWESYKLHAKQAQYYKDCYEKAVTANKTNNLLKVYKDYIEKLVQSQKHLEL